MDDSGQNHIGYVRGATYTEDGRSKGAYAFNGIDNYILIGNLGFYATGSITFWMNADAVENHRNPLTTDYAGWDDCIRFEESNTGEFSGGGLGLGRGDIFSRALEPQRWYHVAYIWDASYVYGYLDGNLIFKNPHPGPSSKVHPDLPLTAGEYKQSTLNFTNVAIGNGYSMEAERYWKGRIDEVRIYNRPLNANEVHLLAQGRQDGLLLYYNFDSNNGSTVIDQSGMGHNATISGAAFVTQGRIGNALQFDGIDDALIVNAAPILDIGDDLTLAAWFYTTSNQQQPIIEWSSPTKTGVHLWTNTTGFQWQGLGTGANLVDTAGNEFDHVISIANPALNQWHHLTVTYAKSTGIAQLYLDGVLAAKRNLGSFTPLTNLPLFIGRRITGEGISFKGKLDDIRIYNKALASAEIRAMIDANTHGKVYQNFEANNGTGTEYGWPINTQFGITAALTTGIKHTGAYSWKMTIPYGTPSWWGGSAVKSKIEQWHLNLESSRHDRLTFWVLANPSAPTPQAIRIKFFDHNKYAWDPANNKDGFIIQTDQQAPANTWAKLTVYLSQLPADFNNQDLDKIEFYAADPGTYYLDDIEITSGDRIYQAFEKRAGVTTADPEEYGWAWNGTKTLTTTQPAEGAQSWAINATNILPTWAGTGIKYQGKDFWNNLTPNDIWNLNLWPSLTHPGLYNQVSFFLKQTGANQLENNVEVGFFDNGSFASGQKIWSARRSDYGAWAKITIPLNDLSADFNFHAFNKIEMALYWPGGYYFDDLRFLKYPTLQIDETRLSSGIIAWGEYPGAAKYILQRATSGILGPWSTVYTGNQNLYQTTNLSACWYRVRWESDTNTARGTVGYVSNWSDAAYYTPTPVLIEKDKLQNGFVEWTFIPQASIYEIQESSSKFGPWTKIYSGIYSVPPPIMATLGKWYRASAVQKNAGGTVTARSAWSPALLYDPAAFVTAEGTALRRKKTTGEFLKLTGVNFGNYLSWEPWMFFGRNHPFVQNNVYPDDWSIRQSLLRRFDIGNDGLTEILNAYRRAYIQETDLNNLMRQGVNVIRLPLYIQDIRPIDDFGNWETSTFDFSAIDRIVKLSGDRGLYVILDLHGAPGCQSDKDATGRVNFNRLFSPDSDVFRTRTVELWSSLAEHYKNNTTVLGYDLLNEPFGVLTQGYYPTQEAAYAALWTLYNRIYNAIRAVPSQNGANDTNHLIIIEGIPSDRDWDTLPNPTAYGWSNVMYQLHYYGFNFDENGNIIGVKSYEDHIAYLNDKLANSKQALYKVPVQIGEFNGFGEARIWKLLLDTFNAQGWQWCSWSYKNHDVDEWGWYAHSDYNENVPDPQNDSLPTLVRKMSKYATQQYHRPNNSLLNIIKAKALLPAYIHNLTAAKGNGSVKLIWSAPYSTSSITKYIIRYGTVSSGAFNSTWTDNASPGATITGLSNGVTYQFRVEAVNANGTGPSSNTVTATPNV